MLGMKGIKSQKHPVMKQQSPGDVMYSMLIKTRCCGAHFAVYTNIKLCCTPETNIVLGVNCISKKKRKEQTGEQVLLLFKGSQMSWNKKSTELLSPQNKR